MATAQLSYEKQKDVPYVLSVGAGGRYYIVQNGLYLGASALFKHHKGYDDLLPSVNVGYAFFISRTVTIEPELYYEQSFKNHTDYSQVWPAYWLWYLSRRTLLKPQHYVKR